MMEDLINVHSGLTVELEEIMAQEKGPGENEGVRAENEMIKTNVLALEARVEDLTQQLL